jgi:hypothetical protein
MVLDSIVEGFLMCWCVTIHGKPLISWSMSTCEDEEQGLTSQMISQGVLKWNAQVQAKFKFTYVVSAQIYGSQRSNSKEEDQEKAVKYFIFNAKVSFQYGLLGIHYGVGNWAFSCVC